MNWFKKTFGKRVWKTLYSKKIIVTKTTFNTVFGYNVVKDINAYFIFQYDADRGEYRSYYTDGSNTLTSVALPIAILEFPELDAVLKQHNLTFD